LIGIGLSNILQISEICLVNKTEFRMSEMVKGLTEMVEI